MKEIEVYGASATNDGTALKGSSRNPYTYREFETMADNGTWKGGFVVGYGYIAKGVTIIGSPEDSEYSYSWDDSWWILPSDSWASGSDEGSVSNSEQHSGGGQTGETPTDTGHAGETYKGRSDGRNTSDGSYSTVKAITYIEKNAYPHYIEGKCGQCAKAVRQALEAGGLSTIGHPSDACEYDSFLPSLGFQKLEKSNYSPKAGDIIVLEAVRNHPHGHIAMYTGSKWISDFVQTDMWGGSAFRNKAEYTLWRR